MGLSISDAIRLLMLRIADEHRRPFEVKVPNAATRKAISELENGNGNRFTGANALMADLVQDTRIGFEQSEKDEVVPGPEAFETLRKRRESRNK